jgi:hypothetical protein
MREAEASVKDNQKETAVQKGSEMIDEERNEHKYRSVHRRPLKAIPKN